MRICFFSDIHGNIFSFQEFIKQISLKSIDYCIFGGDVIGYYYHANEIISILREKNIKCLLGNHDNMFLQVLDGLKDETELICKYGNSYKGIVKEIEEENVNFLRSLKPFLEITEDGKKLAFFHGGPQEPLTMRIYPDTPLEDIEELKKYDYVFTGHTHHKMLRKCDKCLVVNPGSLGQQRDGKGCSYVIFDTKTEEIEFCVVEYDVERLMLEIQQRETEDEMKNKLQEVLIREARISN